MRACALRMHRLDDMDTRAHLDRWQLALSACNGVREQARTQTRVFPPSCDGACCKRHIDQDNTLQPWQYVSTNRSQCQTVFWGAVFVN